ncbi:MAG: tetratricopeptide repeat protein [Deltaproteobacteria bacterium]|nr:tetratricopeptide repeat protein [Deltaproteobacteria bacterium]
MAKRGAYWKPIFIFCVLTLFFAGRYEAAQEKLREAVMFAEAAGQKVELAIALNNLAEVYRLKGERTEALNYYRRALAIYDEIGHQPGVRIVRKQIEETQKAPGGPGEANLEGTMPPEQEISTSLRERLIHQAIEQVKQRVRDRQKEKEEGYRD